MVNLTNKLVASVKPPRDKKYIRLWDSNISGFGLRVTDKGVKSFIFEGRQGLSKKTKQVKIGRVGEMSVAEARTNAAELSRKFRSGEYEKVENAGYALAIDVNATIERRFISAVIIGRGEVGILPQYGG